MIQWHKNNIKGSDSVSLSVCCPYCKFPQLISVSGCRKTVTVSITVCLAHIWQKRNWELLIPIPFLQSNYASLAHMPYQTNDQHVGKSLPWFCVLGQPWIPGLAVNLGLLVIFMNQDPHQTPLLLEKKGEIQIMLGCCMLGASLNFIIHYLILKVSLCVCLSPFPVETKLFKSRNHLLSVSILSGLKVF